MVPSVGAVMRAPTPTASRTATSVVAGSVPRTNHSSRGFDAVTVLGNQVDSGA